MEKEEFETILAAHLAHLYDALIRGMDIDKASCAAWYEEIKNFKLL